MDFEALKSKLVEELINSHGCHTVILYGSRARGDFTEQSDIDVLGIREHGEAFRIGRPWHGTLLDAWIYSEENLPKIEALLYIKDGIVLRERGDFGSALLDKIYCALKAPPEPIPHWDIELRITWIKKMLGRAAMDDAEGNYRRHWLLFDLLETWFAFSNLRYQGVKESLRILERTDRTIYLLFDEALKPQASLDTITKLGNAVVSQGQFRLEKHLGASDELVR